MLKARIAVLVSGSGTNLQALINAHAKGEMPSGEIVLVISSKSGVLALERAGKAGIPTEVIERKNYSDVTQFEEEILTSLKNNKIDVVVLAGFMHILSKSFVSVFTDRIINIHPSLIPSFCGEGFYGLRVHQAALDYGVKITGATVHIVNEIPDGGKILFQKAIDILDSDTPQSLQRRVMEECEWVILPRGCELICKTVIGGKDD